MRARTTPAVRARPQFQGELSQLPLLISNGTSPDAVADLVFDGLREGRKYIYTDEEHTVCAIDDRVDQLKSGGLTVNFKRRMEAVVHNRHFRNITVLAPRRLQLSLVLVRYNQCMIYCV